MKTTPSIYTEALALGVTIDHHESDLYLPKTQSTISLVQKHGKTDNATVFMFQGVEWYDIPFAYDPYWRLDP